MDGPTVRKPLEINEIPTNLNVCNECPRQDSNLRTRLRRPMLYPLSYEGGQRESTWWVPRCHG